MAPKVERRVDPADGAAYTFEELSAFYTGTYTKAAINAYWDACKPAKGAQPKAKAKVEAKEPKEAKPKVELRKPASEEEVIKRVSDCKVIPVVKIDELAQAVPLAKALKAGGVDVVEITFRTECAAAAMREVSENVEGVFVGAGTVLTPKQVDEAVDNGADFIISPGFDAAVAKRCKARGALYIPAVITPTELMLVTSRFKLKYLKFFPASNFGGVGTLKSYGAVFPDVKIMPTGGITEANIREFTSLPNIYAAGGSWFVSDALVKKAVETGDWSPITTASKAASKAAKGE